MGLAGDGLHAHGDGCASIGPCDGQCNDDEQATELFDSPEAGVFQVEATGLGIREEALDTPSLAIVPESMRRISLVRRHDQQLTVSQAFCS